MVDPLLPDINDIHIGIHGVDEVLHECKQVGFGYTLSVYDEVGNTATVHYVCFHLETYLGLVVGGSPDQDCNMRGKVANACVNGTSDTLSIKDQEAVLVNCMAITMAIAGEFDMLAELLTIGTCAKSELIKIKHMAGEQPLVDGSATEVMTLDGMAKMSDVVDHMAGDADTLVAGIKIAIAVSKVNDQSIMLPAAIASVKIEFGKFGLGDGLGDGVGGDNGNVGMGVDLGSLLLGVVASVSGVVTAVSIVVGVGSGARCRCKDRVGSARIIFSSLFQTDRGEFNKCGPLTNISYNLIINLVIFIT